MNELVTDGTSGPTSTKHRLIPIEVLSANSTEAGLNPEQHRLPFTTGFSNTHSEGSIAARPAKKQAKGRLYVNSQSLSDFDLHSPLISDTRPANGLVAGRPSPSRA